MLFDESDARRENGGKSEEETAEHRTVSLRQYPRDQGDCTAKKETRGVFVPLRSGQDGCIEVNSHGLPLQYQQPSTKGGDQPKAEPPDANRCGAQPPLGQQVAAYIRVETEGEGSGNHRARLEGGELLSAGLDRQSKRCQRYGRGGTE